MILVRVTPGVDADTHPSIRTAHEGSKFGLPPEQALEALARAHRAGLEAAGVHVHIGSQLLDTGAALTTVDWVGGFAARCRERARVDTGCRRPRRRARNPVRRGSATAARSRPSWAVLLERLETVWAATELPLPQLVLEPGRSLVGRAGLTLYEVGVVKQVEGDTTYVAVDGGMSDNPRPQLYDAAYTGLLRTAPTRSRPARTSSAASTASRATS